MLHLIKIIFYVFNSIVKNKIRFNCCLDRVLPNAERFIITTWFPVEELRKRLNDVKSSQPSCAPPQPPPMPCAPPPPPPPPPASMPPAPPPPPPMAFTQNMKSVKLRTVNALNPTEGDAIKEMGNYLGMDSVPKTPQVQNGKYARTHKKKILRTKRKQSRIMLLIS